jgi:hypothetical protein
LNSEDYGDGDLDEESRKPECMACQENEQLFVSLASRVCPKYDFDDEDHHYFVPGAICSSCCKLEFDRDTVGCFDVCQDDSAIPENLKGRFDEVFKLEGLKKSEFRKTEAFTDDIGSFLISENLGVLLKGFDAQKVTDYTEDEANDAVYVKGRDGVFERYSLERFRDIKSRMRPALSWLLHDMRTTPDGLLFLVCDIGGTPFGAIVAPQDRELIRPSDVVRSYVERSEELRTFFGLHPVVASPIVDERISSALERLDENGVIDRVAVPLLKSFGFIGVERVPHHGQGELGLDIGPFFKPNKFNPEVLEYAGAQVKAQKIYGKAGAKEGSVYELIDEIDAAFEASRTIGGREEHIRELYVICSREITQQAKDLLEDKIKTLGDERKLVILIKRARLIEMIQEYKIPIAFE